MIVTSIRFVLVLTICSQQSSVIICQTSAYSNDVKSLTDKAKIDKVKADEIEAAEAKAAEKKAAEAKAAEKKAAEAKAAEKKAAKVKAAEAKAAKKKEAKAYEARYNKALAKSDTKAHVYNQLYLKVCKALTDKKKELTYDDCKKSWNPAIINIWLLMADKKNDKDLTEEQLTIQQKLTIGFRPEVMIFLSKMKHAKRKKSIKFIDNQSYKTITFAEIQLKRIYPDITEVHMDKNYKLLTLIFPLMVVKRNLDIKLDSFIPLETIIYGLYTGQNLIFDTTDKRSMKDKKTGRKQKIYYSYEKEDKNEGKVKLTKKKLEDFFKNCWKKLSEKKHSIIDLLSVYNDIESQLYVILLSNSQFYAYHSCKSIFETAIEEASEKMLASSCDFFTKDLNFYEMKGDEKNSAFFNFEFIDLFFWQSKNSLQRYIKYGTEQDVSSLEFQNNFKKYLSEMKTKSFQMRDKFINTGYKRIKNYANVKKTEINGKYHFENFEYENHKPFLKLNRIFVEHLFIRNQNILKTATDQRNMYNSLNRYSKDILDKMNEDNMMYPTEDDIKYVTTNINTLSMNKDTIHRTFVPSAIKIGELESDYNEEINLDMILNVSAEKQKKEQDKKNQSAEQNYKQRNSRSFKYDYGLKAFKDKKRTIDWPIIKGKTSINKVSN